MFPHKDKETLSSDEILKLEVSYVINLLKRAQPSPREQDDIEDVDQIYIPISRLMNFTRISKLVNIESLRWLQFVDVLASFAILSHFL